MQRHLLSITLLAASLWIATATNAAGNHDHAPQHGGIVAEAQGADYELVATPTQLRLYLRDHGKPLDLAQASARVTLLSGADRQEVELKPAGDRLEAAGDFKVGPGTKAVAVAQRAGKSLGSARFTLK
ncbi:MAG TPA: hypothetical protein VE084_12035 [Burkholderiaceae bacterium]|nr:hypothetical protein [Burkholderiaceae bacterium]